VTPTPRDVHIALAWTALAFLPAVAWCLVLEMMAALAAKETR